MDRHRLVFACSAFVLALGTVAPPAFAGLEFCINPPPECDDHNPCTCDIQNSDGTCTHDPRSRHAAAARAWGISADLGGQTAIPPTPDSNAKNPDTLIDIPADPAAHVSALHVEEVEENLNGNSESHAKAIATTGSVKVLDQGGGNWLLTMDSLKSVSESTATDQSATTSTDGSTLHNVVLNGVNLGDVSEPMDFSFQEPLSHQRIDVRLLQKLRVGAAAGDPVPDPKSGVVFSGVTVNAVRVTVRDVTDPANPKPEVDIIIGHADSRVDRFSNTTCTETGGEVSGNGFVVGIDADETAIDPIRELVRTRIGEVVLPSRGGSDDAHLDHIGPIVDPSSGNLALESQTAFSHTEGQVTDQPQSATESAIEKLRAFDQGKGPQVSADLVRAECTSSADSGDTAKTTIAGLVLGGNDVCQQLQLGSACTPDPNTHVTNSGDLDVILNEQTPDASKDGCSGITVNAVHIHALGPGNSIGLPLGADVIISKAHCDSCKAPSGTPTPPPYYNGAPLNSSPSKTMALSFAVGAVGLLLPRRRVLVKK
jgi:hypothetical protein